MLPAIPERRAPPSSPHPALVPLPSSSPTRRHAPFIPSIPKHHPHRRKEDWLSSVADPLEKYLFFLQDQLRKANVPFAQGVSIVLLTLSVKLITFPFTRKQVESGMAMQNLQPQIAALRERWPGEENASRLNQELQALYDRYGVNPLAGCFPTLITLPVFWRAQLPAGPHRLPPGECEGAARVQSD